jgi:hypothetical protein
MFPIIHQITHVNWLLLTRIAHLHVCQTYTPRGEYAGATNFEDDFKVCEIKDLTLTLSCADAAS